MYVCVRACVRLCVCVCVCVFVQMYHSTVKIELVNMSTCVHNSCSLSFKIVNNV